MALNLAGLKLKASKPNHVAPLFYGDGDRGSLKRR